MPLKREKERKEPALEMEECGGVSPKELVELLAQLMEKVDRIPRTMEEALEKACQKSLLFGQEIEFKDEILEERKMDDKETERGMPAEEQEVRGNMELDLLILGVGGAGNEENGFEERTKGRWMLVGGGGGGEEQGRGNMETELLRSGTGEIARGWMPADARGEEQEDLLIFGVGGAGKEKKNNPENGFEGRTKERWMPAGGGGEEQEGRGYKVKRLRSGLGGTVQEKKSKRKNKEQENYNLPRDGLLDNQEKVRILRRIIWKQEEGGLFLRQEDRCYKHERQKEIGLTFKIGIYGTDCFWRRG